MDRKSPCCNWRLTGSNLWSWRERVSRYSWHLPHPSLIRCLDSCQNQLCSELALQRPPISFFACFSWQARLLISGFRALHDPEFCRTWLTWRRSRSCVRNKSQLLMPESWDLRAIAYCHSNLASRMNRVVEWKILGPSSQELRDPDWFYTVTVVILHLGHTNKGQWGSELGPSPVSIASQIDVSACLESISRIAWWSLA